MLWLQRTAGNAAVVHALTGGRHVEAHRSRGALTLQRTKYRWNGTVWVPDPTPPRPGAPLPRPGDFVGQVFDDETGEYSKKRKRGALEEGPGAEEPDLKRGRTGSQPPAGATAVTVLQHVTFFTSFTPAEALTLALTSRAHRLAVQPHLDWLRDLLGPDCAPTVRRLLDGGVDILGVIRLSHALPHHPPAPLCERAVAFVHQHGLRFADLAAIASGAGLGVAFSDELFDLFDLVLRLQAATPKVLVDVGLEVRLCVRANVTVASLISHLPSAALDLRLALQCIRLSTAHGLPVDFQQWVIAHPKPTGKEWTALLAEIGRALRAGMSLVLVGELCRRYLTRESVVGRLAGMKVIFAALPRLTGPVADELVGNQQRWPRSFPHVVEMLTGLRGCQDQRQGLLALRGLAYDLEQARPVLACLGVADLPHDIAMWVCVNRLPLGESTEDRVQAAKFVVDSVVSGVPLARETAMYVVSGFADSARWAAHFTFVSDQGRAQSLDAVHERFQMLLHAAGNAHDAARHVASPRFDAAFARNLLARGPLSARLHVADNVTSAQRAAMNRCLGRGPRGPTDRPDSHSVVPVGIAGMAPHVAAVMNQFRAQIRSLAVGAETPLLVWNVTGAGNVYISTGGNAPVTTTWTRLEVIVFRQGEGDPGLGLKHCQPK